MNAYAELASPRAVVESVLKIFVRTYIEGLPLRYEDKYSTSKKKILMEMLLKVLFKVTIQ